MAFEWSDLRYFLAVARERSTLAAASVTGASQSTVTRRIAALEEALQIKLFERLPHGTFLTDQGEALRAIAEQAEAEMERFGQTAQQLRRQLSGTIRFTMPPEGADPYCAEPIAAFVERNPGVKIELMLTDDRLDIAAGEADVALRAGPRPTEPSLIVRKVVEHYWSCWCSRGYLEQHGAPSSYDDLARHKVIEIEGKLAHVPAIAWFLARAPQRAALRASTIKAMLGYARTGIGIALLPDSHDAQASGLVRVLPPIMELPSDVWIVTREDIRHAPHVRAFIDFIAAHLLIATRTLLEAADRADIARLAPGPVQRAANA
jgi:DNA-binding transcriptional LysR family regulator